MKITQPQRVRPSASNIPKGLLGTATIREIAKRMGVHLWFRGARDSEEQESERLEEVEVSNRFMDDLIRAVITRISREYLDEGVGDPEVLMDSRLTELALRRINNVKREGVWDHYSAAYLAVERLQRAERIRKRISRKRR